MAELRNWTGPQAVKAIRQRLRHNANAAMLVGVNAIKLKLSEPWPPASAPGEAPHVRTGTLRRGVTGRVEDDSKGIVILVGVAGVPYAADLEFGKSRLAPRPYIRPAIQENKKEIFNALGGR